MFNFKKIRSILALLLLAAMLLSVLVSCDITSLFTKKVIVIKRTTKSSGTVYGDPMVDPIDDNNRTLYQIYVRSFADSNADGIGDIRGIIDKFDYLNDGDINSGEDLGVQAIWLTPIFYGSSPHKYDAIDFYQIDPEFGTEKDLKDLIDLCNERNVKLVLDLALNHTSTSNDWFKQSRDAHKSGNTSNKYYNYYNWSTYKKDGYVQLKDTNWWYESWFDLEGGSMPDLNYDNQNVRNEMLNVAKYWMELGVHGFRFDAVKVLYGTNDQCTAEQHRKSAEFYEWYTGELRKINPEIYLVGECWDNEANMLKYYNAMNCFNFKIADQGNGVLVNAVKETGNMSTYVDYISNLQQRIKNVNPNGVMSNFLTNHDQDRSHHFLKSNELKKMAASLYLLTPGTPVIYYGEEIGLEGDGESANDANLRLPMKWGDNTYTCKISSDVSIKYKNMNLYSNSVFDQQYDSDSLLMHYSKVLSIRNRYPAIARGTYKPLYGGISSFAGFFVDYGNEDVIILHNTSSTQTVTIDLKNLKTNNDSKLLAGYSSFTILDYVGVNDATINGTVLTLGPQTTVILK